MKAVLGAVVWRTKTVTTGVRQQQLDESLAIIDECLGLLEEELRQKGWVPT